MAVTDLRGTKWLLNETIDIFANDEYSVSFNSGGKSFDILYVSADTGEIYYSTDIEDTIAYDGLDWTDQAYRTIEITGGTDATNPDAISFMQTNGKQIIEPTANEYTLTQTLTNLTSGNITLTITADEGYSLPAQADIVVTGGSIVSYDDETGELVVTAGTTAVEVTCAVSTISFSIDNITYQAEDGMTWAQWCDSAYNTDGCYIANGGVCRANAIDSHLCSYSTNDNVLSTDTIVENGHYFWSSGGSND